MLQGTRTFVLQDDDGNIELTHSISAGLDYAAVGPGARVAARARPRRVRLRRPTTRRSRRSRRWRGSRASCRRSSRRTPIAYAQRVARELGPSATVLVNLSGRGDKDVQTVEKRLRPRELGARREPDRRHVRAIRAESGRGLVTFTTAGDPDLPRSAEILKALDRAGADVIEVGVPFSDPLADGPVIQRATERALAAGGSLRDGARDDCRRPSARSRRRSSSSATPTRCCGWASTRLRARRPRPAWTACWRSICRSRRPETSARRSRRAGIDTIFLLSPTTTDARIREGGGARAAVSLRHLAAGRDRRARRRWRRAPKRWSAASARTTTMPIALGFGISRPEHVAEVCAYADAAVVGSALVALVAEAGASAGPDSDVSKTMCGG